MSLWQCLNGASRGVMARSPFLFRRGCGAPDAKTAMPVAPRMVATQRTLSLEMETADLVGDLPQAPIPKKKARVTRSENAPSLKNQPPRKPTAATSDDAATKKTAPAIQLSEKQQEVVDAALAGKSFVLSGGAGTGKSAIIREITRRCAEGQGGAALMLCAPTGVAAINIGGGTIHQSFGFTPDQERKFLTVGKCSSKVAVSTVQRLKRLRTVVIDEVSMLTPLTLHCVDTICRLAKNAPDVPFGGLQMILCGDFLQLPPVLNKKDWAVPIVTRPHPGGPVTSLPSGWPPEKPVWKPGEKAPPRPVFDFKRAKYCFQTKPWADLDPKTFFLTETFRQSEPKLLSILNNARVGRAIPEDYLELTKHELPEYAVKIRSTNKEVDALNNSKYDAIPSREFVFHGVEKGFGKNGGSLCPKRLTLKVGTRVMLLKNVNVDEGLANGSTGTVVGFVPGDRDPVAYKHQLLDDVNPVVDFGGTVGTRVVGRAEWMSTIGDKVTGAYVQIPLRHAWAITAHKAQGMTIDYLDVDLGRCFEYGQAYVALSRGRTFENLRVTGFDAKKIRACPIALSFYGHSS